MHALTLYVLLEFVFREHAIPPLCSVRALALHVQLDQILINQIKHFLFLCNQPDYEINRCTINQNIFLENDGLYFGICNSYAIVQIMQLSIRLERKFCPLLDLIFS